MGASVCPSVHPPVLTHTAATVAWLPHVNGLYSQPSASWSVSCQEVTAQFSRGNVGHVDAWSMCRYFSSSKAEALLGYAPIRRHEEAWAEAVEAVVRREGLSASTAHTAAPES